MFSSSKLKTQANGKMQKKTWWLFHATDFESLMYPSFTFCYILGIFPYKINASVFKISTPRYICSTVVICVCFICLLYILYIFNTLESLYKFKGVPRILERNWFYILNGFVVVITYILSGPRMRLLQIIMELSSKLPSKSYQKLSRLIHIKDILGFFIVSTEVPMYFHMNILLIVKILIFYVNLLVLQMDMLYMNCVCILKTCFKRVSDNLEDMQKLMMDNEGYHFGQMYYKQRNSFFLIELKALEKQHLMISNAVQMLNMIFSLHVLATILMTFVEMTFCLYFHILYWQRGISMINVDNYIYGIYMTIRISYYLIKITLIVWACETSKNQAVQIGTTVHDVLNSMDNNEIKSEVEYDLYIFISTMY